jgi:hypothetical protein
MPLACAQPSGKTSFAKRAFKGKVLVGPSESNRILKLAVAVAAIAQFATLGNTACFMPTPYGTYCSGGDTYLCDAG